MSQPAVIVHLSDLQFGEYHRFKNGNQRYIGDHPYKTLFNTIISDLDGLRLEYGIEPNIIVVTGDLTEQSAWNEYEEALRFLQELSSKLKISRSNVIVVPGNHDVNWHLCSSAREEAKAYGMPFKPPHFKKFALYERFLKDFYKTSVKFSEKHLFTIHPCQEQGVIFVGLDSCVKETDQEHVGYIGVDQLRSAGEECNEEDKERKLLRIAVMHHNFLSRGALEKENLSDAMELNPGLNHYGFSMILHGHRHVGMLGGLWDPGSGKHIALLGTGSAGLDSDTLPDHPNQYQVIFIDRGQITVYGRQYSTQSIGLDGQGNWLPDPNIGKNGVFPITLPGTPAIVRKKKSKVRKPSTAKSRNGTLKIDRKHIERYRKFVFEEHRYLPVKGFETDLKVPIELEDVYVTLRARLTAFEEIRRKGAFHGETFTDRKSVNIAEAIRLCREKKYCGIVVLGPPGCGKTTLLKYVSLLLCTGKHADLPGATSDTLPLYLPLRDVPDTSKHITQMATIYYAAKGRKLPEDFFEKALDARQVFVLLDGLDEVPTEDARRKILIWIDAIRKNYPGNPIIVTSRYTGYRHGISLENYLELDVIDFTPDDIARFLNQWYIQVETQLQEDTTHWRKKGENDAADLFDRIQKRKELKELAVNPLMLQIIALVHRARGTLPERRVELYKECTEVLLEKWDRAKGLELYFTAQEARQILQPLALWLHSVENRREATSKEIAKFIAPYIEQLGKSAEEIPKILQSIRDRSGLFTGYGIDSYGFQHLSFQEYLTAEQVRNKSLFALLVKEFDVSWWREPTLLAMGLSNPGIFEPFIEKVFASGKANKSREFLLACIRDTLLKSATPFANGFKSDDWETRYTCVLALREIKSSQANQALESVLNDEDNRVADLARQILVERGVVKPKVKVPKIEVVKPGEVFVNPKDGMELVFVPAGEFIMGSNKYKDEKPQKKAYLGAYFIGRYPVTNAQYAKFLKATNHKEPIFWDDKRFNGPNQPVVGVTWHDAVAYYKWAGLALPSEEEWEKAARGIDGREYPWGNKWDAKRCNNSKTGPGRTTDVGSYPEGASPYGCQDMAGNVWEWTASKYNPKDKSDNADRVLRGGSWIYYNPDDFRCAIRFWYYPGLGNGTVGFRCVVRRGKGL